MHASSTGLPEPRHSRRRLRLLRLVPVLDFGGVESGLVVQAALHDRARFDLRICTFWRDGKAAALARAQGVPVDVLDISPSIRNVRAAPALAKYLRDVRPDIVHASVPEADIHAAVVGRLAGVPVTILDEAGMPHRSLPKRLAFAALHRRANANVAVSQALRDYLVEREFAPRNSVFVVYNCGGREFFQSPKTNYEITGSRFRLVTVGRLVDVKNKSVLIDAVARLASRGVDVELVLLGEGPLRPILERQVAERRIGDRVKIAGFVDDLASELRRADGYALPSLSEGCSLSLIEAMGMALPVIASRVPGNQEVMLGADSAWLPDPTDTDGWAKAIAKLAGASPAERARLGAAARAIAVEHFSPEVYVQGLERVYEAVYARIPRSA